MSDVPMGGPISWFARNPIAANLLMAMILFGGVISLLGIAEEVFPETETGIISIVVPFPGAAPQEVEEGICVKIEEAIWDLEGIDTLRSSASEGVGRVSVELEDDADARRVLSDIEARIDALETLPEEAEEPVMQEVTFRRHVVNIAIYGDVSEMALRRTADRLRERLLAETLVTQATFASARPYEITVEVSESALRRHGITFDAIANAVGRSSLDLPGGSLRTDEGDILLRTKGQRYRGEEFAEIPILSRPDGTRLLVGDVARVIDGFADQDQSARFNDLPAVQIRVFRGGDQSATEIGRAVRRFVIEARAQLPDAIQLATWQDNSLMLKSRLDLLKRNGLYGLVLVFGVLALFLRMRLALWISVGIGVSFLGALWVMPVVGASLNMITAFGFILVLGIVVDDAIVVGESVFREQHGGKPGLAGVISGTHRVAVPVIFAVATTITAFWPLLHVPGAMGKLFQQIPFVVIPTLAFSLVESLWILPAHLRHAPDPARRHGSVGASIRHVQDLFASWLEWFTQKCYRPSLEVALRMRYLTLSVFSALVILTAGIVGGGFLSFSFMPKVEADNVVASLTMPRGTSTTAMHAAVEQVVRAALRLREEIDPADGDGPSVFHNVLTSIGEQPFQADQRRNAGGVGGNSEGANIAEVNVELAPSEVRGKLSSEEVARRWRELTGRVPGALELTFGASLFSTGNDIDILLSGDDLAELGVASQWLREHLEGIVGVSEVRDSLRAGKEELRLTILPEAEHLGLTLADLARQIRQGFHGEEAQRIQRGRDDIKVMVRYPESERRSIADLEAVRIRTPGGDEVPFQSVARVERTRGLDSIERIDRRRGVHVLGTIDREETSTEEVFAAIEAQALPGFERAFPHVSWSHEGEQRDQAETLGSLIEGFMLALVAIYALMAIPFRSWLQPLIIMSAIPFGIVGAALGHVLLDLELSIVSLFGLIALAGVVVNDNLVLVDTINRLRREGASLDQAIRVAGAVRLRPILLTSLTTFAGLTPLLLESSLQAKFMVPMAVSLGFGVLFATAISLILVPVIYQILEDLFRILGIDERWIADVEEEHRQAVEHAATPSTESW